MQKVKKSKIDLFAIVDIKSKYNNFNSSVQEQKNKIK